MNQNKGVTLIIYKEAYHQEYKKYIEGSSQKIIAVDVDENPHLQELSSNTRYKIIEDYLTESDLLQIQKEAVTFARTWYKVHGQDLTTCEGISLGQVMEYQTVILLIEIFKSASLVKKIVAIDKPDKVLLVDDGSLAARVIIHWLSAKGIFMEVINPSLGNRLKKFMLQIKHQMVIVTEFGKAVLKRVIRVIYQRRRKNIEAKLKGNDYRYNILIHKAPRTGYLVDKLKENKLNRLLVVYGSSREKIMNRDENIVFIDYLQYIDRQMKKRLCWIKQDLQRRWLALGENIDLKNQLTYLGQPFWEIVEEKLRYFFEHDFIELARITLLSKKILSQEKVDIIISTYDVYGPEKVMAMVANSKGKPTLSIQHGHQGGRLYYPYTILPTSKKIAVWGKAVMDWYRTQGLSPEKVSATGEPTFDSLVNKEIVLHPEIIRRHLRVKKGRKIIVFASTPKSTISALSPFWLRLRLFEELLQAKQQLSDVELIIKLHPRENEDLIDLLIKKSGVKGVKVIKKFDTYGLLNICDILITYNSSMASEAILLRKPVINLTSVIKINYSPWVEEGAAIAADTVEKLVAAIKDILEDSEVGDQLEKGRKRFIARYLTGCDGKATQRMINLIMEMCHGGRNRIKKPVEVSRLAEKLEC